MCCQATYEYCCWNALNWYERDSRAWDFWPPCAAAWFAGGWPEVSGLSGRGWLGVVWGILPASGEALIALCALSANLEKKLDMVRRGCEGME
jgi:hypothetical protein